MSRLFEEHLLVAGRVLDFRLQRQNLVMANLANAQTPGYQPRRLEFEESLQDALALDQRGRMTRTSEAHAPAAFQVNGFDSHATHSIEPRLVYGEDSVDIDREMVIMSKNAMMYDALTQVVTKNFKGLQQTIQDGAR